MADPLGNYIPEFIEKETEREAIVKLAKMVTDRIPQKLGMKKITKYDPEYWGLDDIRDIYDIRARLEGLCARWAAEKITDELMEQMEEIIYLSEFHEEKGNSKQLLLLDNRFHEILYEASQSKELKRILKEYHEYVGRVRRVTLSENERAKDSTMEHKMICQAIKAHDADLAEKYASAHIIKSKENMQKRGWENLIK